MKILISNDDGFRAEGIVALYEALKTIADVEVVAPEQNNSAKSNALTLHTPLYVQRADNGFRYVNGTPADCVHIALTGLLGYRPDLVISGINNGANMGDDTLYSGTVGAAMEGFLFGIPALAVSQIDKGWAHLDAAAATVRSMVLQMQADNLVNARPWLLNVNIPNLPLAEDQVLPKLAVLAVAMPQNRSSRKSTLGAKPCIGLAMRGRPWTTVKAPISMPPSWATWS